MASQNVKSVTLTAGESLDGDIYEIVMVDTDGTVIKTTAATDAAIGVISESLDATTGADGNAVRVDLFGAGGILEVKAGGTITAGDLVAADGTSAGADLAAVAADVVVVGVALESAVTGDVIQVIGQVMSSATET